MVYLGAAISGSTSLAQGDSLSCVSVPVTEVKVGVGSTFSSCFGACTVSVGTCNLSPSSFGVGSSFYWGGFLIGWTSILGSSSVLGARRGSGSITFSTTVVGASGSAEAFS